MSSPADAPRTSGKTIAFVLVPAAVLVATVMLLLRVKVQPRTIPPYAIAAGAVSEIVPGRQFSLTLDPQGQLTGAVAARGYLVRGDEVRPWEPHFEVERDGSIQVTGADDTLFAGVPAGDWDLALVVGRPEALPRSAADTLRPAATDAGAAAFWVVRHRVHVHARG